MERLPRIHRRLVVIELKYEFNDFVHYGLSKTILLEPFFLCWARSFFRARRT